MATRELDIDATPVNLKAAPTSLAQDQRVAIENTGDGSINYSQTAAAPTNRSHGHRLFPNDVLIIAIGVDPFWMWTEEDWSHVSISDID